MNKELLQQALDRIEADWQKIDGEWGPFEGGLDGAIARGEEPLIVALRDAIAQPESHQMTTQPIPELPAQSVLDTHLPTGVKLYGYTADQMQAYALAAIAATQQAGYQLVPIEPTMKMIEAGKDAELFQPSCRSALVVYRAMLAAAAATQLGPITPDQAKAKALEWHCEAGGELLPQLTANELAGLVNEVAQRQPLTDDRCRSIYIEHGLRGPVEFVRAIETAHGITKGQP